MTLFSRPVTSAYFIIYILCILIICHRLIDIYKRDVLIRFSDHKIRENIYGLNRLWWAKIKEKKHIDCYNWNSDCVHSFGTYENDIVYSQKYRLGSCLIEKSMSSPLSALMCYLHNRSQFVRAGTLLKDFVDLNGTRSCPFDHSFSASNSTRLHAFNLFALIRDPLERFCAAYMDTCRGKNECYDCAQGDIACFLKELKERLRVSAFFGTEKFEYDGKKNTSVKGEFVPQHWQCNFRHHLRHYTLVKYSSSTEKIVWSSIYRILTNNGVSQGIITDIYIQMFGAPRHSYDQLNPIEMAVKMRENEELMTAFYQVYSYDYVVFNIKMPDWED